MKIIVSIYPYHEYTKSVDFACDTIHCINSIENRVSFINAGDKSYVVYSALASTVSVRIADEFDNAPDVKTAAANCDFITVEETV